MKKKIILGIESSCDDTSIALVKNFEVIDCLSLSSAKLQNKFGGVLPELAAREHERVFIKLLKDLLKKNNVFWDDISHIAYTSFPGLKSCLLTGQVFAQTLSYMFNKKLIPVNHIYGHIFSPGISNKLEFPHLSLVVSGKTTALYFVEDYLKIKVLDETTDNALGEVYDKVARMLGLSYPGGPEIDKLFQINLDVKPLLKNKSSASQKFSYSGILSATERYWKNLQDSNIEDKKAYLATVFQKWVVESLVVKIKHWIEKKNVNFLTVSGGVSANKYLKIKLSEISKKVIFVDRKYSSDNAAMISFYASHLIK